MRGPLRVVHFAVERLQSDGFLHSRRGLIELVEKQKAGFVNVIIANGGTEARGPHNILAGHTIMSQRTAIDAAKEIGHTLVAPVMPIDIGATGVADGSTVLTGALHDPTDPVPAELPTTTATEDGFELAIRVWPEPERLAALVDFHGNWIDWFRT